MRNIYKYIATAFVCSIAIYCYAATQGDTVMNVVDPDNSLKVTRVVGTPSTGMRTTIVNTTINPVVVSQGAATALNMTAVQPTAAQLNMTAAQPTAANLNATVVSNYGTLNATTIDFEHYQIHQGKHFKYAYTALIATGATFSVILLAPNTATRVHLGYHAQTDQQFQMWLYESPVYSGGSATAVYNNDRNSGNTPGLQIISGMTVSTTGAGTPISIDLVGSGNTGNNIALNEELILKQGTAYLLTLLNNFTGNGRFTIEVEWYEI